MLAAEGVEVVGFDLGTDDRRLRLATDAEIPLVRGDITDREALAGVLDEHGITHVIHLAALLLPTIKAEPAATARRSTSAAPSTCSTLRRRAASSVAYASSAAVYSQVDDTGGRSRTTPSAHPGDVLRRAQAGVRRARADLLAGGAGAVDRDPPVHRLRARSRHRA